MSDEALGNPGPEEESDGDEDLELPGVSLKQDATTAEKMADGLYECANKARDDLKNHLQEREGDAEGFESLLERIHEIKDRLRPDKRPSAWRKQTPTTPEDDKTPTDTPTDGDSPRATATLSFLPSQPAQSTATSLQSELTALQAKQAVAKGAAVAAAPTGAVVDSVLQEKDKEITTLKAKLEEALANAGSSVKADALSHSRAEEVAELTSKLGNVKEQMRKEFATEIKALKIENEDLRTERENLDRTIIALRLDKEDLEQRLEDEMEEIERRVGDVKKAERARIQQAAMQLQKDMSVENDKKIADVKRKLKREHADEVAKLHEKISDLEDEIHLGQ